MSTDIAASNVTIVWGDAEKDLPNIMRIQESIYPKELVEPEDIFGHIIRTFPGWCLMAKDEDGRVIGHLVAHPWHNDPLDSPSLNEVAPITALERSAQPAPTVVFIHDVSVIPELHGRGIGSRLVQTFLVAKDTPAHACEHVVIVAVRNASGYWARHGFKPAEPSRPEMLASYGDATATFMRLHRSEIEPGYLAN